MVPIVEALAVRVSKSKVPRRMGSHAWPAASPSDLGGSLYRSAIESYTTNASAQTQALEHKHWQRTTECVQEIKRFCQAQQAPPLSLP